MILLGIRNDILIRRLEKEKKTGNSGAILELSIYLFLLLLGLLYLELESGDFRL